MLWIFVLYSTWYILYWKYVDWVLCLHYSFIVIIFVRDIFENRGGTFKDVCYLVSWMRSTAGTHASLCPILNSLICRGEDRNCLFTYTVHVCRRRKMSWDNGAKRTFYTCPFLRKRLKVNHSFPHSLAYPNWFVCYIISSLYSSFHITLNLFQNKINNFLAL